METLNQAPKIIEKQENKDNEHLFQDIIREANSIAIKETDRNKEGLLLAPDGSVSHYQNELYWKALKTDSFKKWFDGSVVIHKDNKEPLMTFHSTVTEEFEGLNLKLPNNDDRDWLSLGVYFSSNRDWNRYGIKELYGEEDEIKTFNSFIKLKNPLKLKSHDKLIELYVRNREMSKQDFLKQGYDGIYAEYEPLFGDEYIVFDQENILIVPSELK